MYDYMQCMVAIVHKKYVMYMHVVIGIVIIYKYMYMQVQPSRPRRRDVFTPSRMTQGTLLDLPEAVN